MKHISPFIVAALLSLAWVLTAASQGAETPATTRVETAAPQTATQEVANAARIERVLNGLRPKVEAEGAPVRWSLTERMAAHKVPAVSIAIIDGGRVVWAQGFGVTEVGGHDPVTATTLFQAASCSKPVAASAMLRLVDKGTLSLDKNVNDYLTSWKLPDNEFTKQEPVTLRRIATHTAGTTVSGFPGYKVGVPRPTVPELLDGKAPANNEPVRVDKLPGQSFRYSGGGTTIMQQLLIDVTGTSFPTLLQQQVFAPLGMTHSTFDQPLPEALAAHAARGHEKDVVVPGNWYVYPELAAAGLWTTPTDLATWAIAMNDAMTGRSTKFLSPATASQIVSSAVPGRSARERVGLGLFLSGSDDNLKISHNGQNEGFLNEFKVFAKTGQGVSIMINVGESGYGLIQEIEFAIAAEYGWPEVGTTKIKAVAVDPADLDRLTGTYVIDIKSGRKLPRVVREGTRLFFEGWGPAREELHPQSPTTFIGARGGTRFTFTRDAAGRDAITMGEGSKAPTGFKQ